MARTREKGKDKFKRTGNVVQEFEARGNAKKTRTGDTLCFNYNLPQGCTLAAPGQRCRNGLHVCSAINCQDKQHLHSAATH